jgi:hypothetical protein
VDRNARGAIPLASTGAGSGPAAGYKPVKAPE